MLTLQVLLDWLKANGLSLEPPPGFHPCTCMCGCRQLREDTAETLAIKVMDTYKL